MILNIWAKINKEGISQLFFIAFLIFVFFPVRFTFPTPQAYTLGIYSDFTSFSLYLSDILLLLSFLFILPRGITTLKTSKFVLLAYLWGIVTIISFFPHISATNWYFFAKFTQILIVAYGTTSDLFKNRQFKAQIIELFFILGTFQSVLAIIQFYKQTSIGLNILGEQLLNPKLFGLAKIVLENKPYLRGYGTFTHPNPLSAFILCVILFNIYFLILSKKRILDIILIFFLFINIFGLIITFSRAGLFASIISLVVSGGFILYKKLLTKKVVFIYVIVATFFLISFLIVKPFMLVRSHVKDSAASERVFYANAGLEMIKSHPFIGLGFGSSILNMEKFSGTKLWPSQKQPIHNYFILAASEFGILGGVLLLIVFLIHVKQIISKMMQSSGEINLLYIFLLSILVSFLALMQFDHYFYTIQQTELLLWVILGLVNSVTYQKN